MAAAELCRGLVELLDVIAKQHGGRIAEGKPPRNGGELDSRWFGPLAGALLLAAGFRPAGAPAAVFEGDDKAHRPSKGGLKEGMRGQPSLNRADKPAKCLHRCRAHAEPEPLVSRDCVASDAFDVTTENRGVPVQVRVSPSEEALESELFSRHSLSSARLVTGENGPECLMECPNSPNFPPARVQRVRRFRPFQFANALANTLAPRRGCRTNPRSVRAGEEDSAMAQNFIDCDREQAFLMPPSLREWLSEDHVAWFVIEAVEGMNLDEFYADYRADGHGRAAYEPSMMVALLLYAYATGQRSARAIERHCRQDIAYRVITANRVPDHATVARFVCRHERALGELFGSVLALCAKAGLLSTGVVAIDGTKIKANASREANSDYERIAREIIAGAKATDEAEDERYGEARGDELPERLRTSEGRRQWLREAKRDLEAERAARVTLVWAVLDLLITHQTNGIRFT